MTFPRLPRIEEVRRRLELIFPEGINHRNWLVREMTAKTVFVMLYGGMIEGTGRRLRPSHVYRFSDQQAELQTDAERQEWVDASNRPRFRCPGEAWFADTTREPIRDETLRGGLVVVGAATRFTGGAVTSSDPIYALAPDFAALFSPELNDNALTDAIAAWQSRHLSAAARARNAIIARGRVRSRDSVNVTSPDGTVLVLSAGPSSLIAKGVIEEFAPQFLANPALVWLSESRTQVRYQDAELAADLGLNIASARVLPDVILANVGDTGDDTFLIFIEVVASDGPMSDQRREELLGLVEGFPHEQCRFGTAFEDRADSAFRRTISELGWGTFAWFRSEPQRLMQFLPSPVNLTAEP